MNSNNVAISVRGLGKSYTISHNAASHSTLAEAMLHKLRRPFQRNQRETFWALRDISFDIGVGEVVGVIGRNGAGKSTLLKVLSRITEPTMGEIDMYGRIGSLLEVGTGFHPELTGRENIFLNGAILGMRRNEIQRQFDAIVDFSGVEKFLDTPVKRYSSGMYVRLAFAVAAHLSSEILVVDEVLAVGDAEFQKRCLGKMKEVATSGRTVLFVSHQMQSVAALCTQAMFLEHGHVKYQGSVPGAIEKYMASFAKPEEVKLDPQRRPGSGEFRITAVSADKDYYECAEPKSVRFVIEQFKPYEGNYWVASQLVNDQGVVLLQFDGSAIGQYVKASSRYEGTFTFRTPWLKPGDYWLDFFLCANGVLDRFERAVSIHVIPLLPYRGSGNPQTVSAGLVFADFEYQETLPALEEALSTGGTDDARR
jgi:lipopolysaccharide transport system ATP-binding protein